MSTFPTLRQPAELFSFARIRASLLIDCVQPKEVSFPKQQIESHLTVSNTRPELKARMSEKSSTPPIRGIRTDAGLSLCVLRSPHYAGITGTLTPYVRLEGPESILVNVGQGEAIYTLPKALLTFHSPFFATALAGSFAEGRSNSVDMPEDTKETFGTFVQWLYLGDIEIDDSIECAQAWVLGDKLGCDGLCNNIISHLLDNYQRKIVSPELVTTIYQHTVPSSKLRKWVLDEFLYESAATPVPRGDDWDKAVELQDFSADVTRAVLGGLIRERDPRSKSDSYRRLV